MTNTTVTPDTDGNPHELPACWSEEFEIDNNSVSQMLVPSSDSALVEEIDGLFSVACPHGKWRIVNQGDEYDPANLVLLSTKVVRTKNTVDLTATRWAGAIGRVSPETVCQSLEGSFNFLREDAALGRKGLRSPQIGAVHAVMGYWTLDQNLPATVVMPTGTGKTETMLSLFAAAQPKLLLVLVPSDALRDQLSNKFETYGVLREFGIVNSSALFPAVGRLRHGFKTVDAARNFAGACNVIVATPHSLSHCGHEAKAALLAECSHLFVDEAHHITAPTWRAIRNEFTGKPVVQFTATPFREDGADLGGKLVYVFPLRSAQEQGYFSKINYSAVVDFDDLDKAIAEKAVGQLRSDIKDKNLDHILFARVNRIGRAQDLLPIYEELAPDLKPVILHSQLKPASAQRDALAAVRRGDSKIVICVNMLGEGFDLPSLKVAAMHDPHKSLGITLQFIGRFARSSGKNIGEASVIVGRTDPNYDENLKKLYAEDADWNHVINNLSAAAVGEQQEIGEFEEGFRSLPEEISLRNIAPKMSTVVYRTYCEDWRMDELEKHFEKRLFTNPIAVNETEHVAWLVTKEVAQVGWGDIKTVEEVRYDLYIFHWDPDLKLLYVNSSNNDSVHEEAAKALCGETVERIRGKTVYRTMAKINRRVPTNVGLLDARDRKRSFAMFSGANVTEAFPTAEAQTKTQTNIFAYGFEFGERVSLGISLKGRIWSHRAAPTVKHWVNWCRHIGSQLVDESINIQDVISGFIQPEEVDVRPDLVPLALEWPWEVYTRLTEDLRLEHDGTAYPLIDVDLKITDFKDEGPIPFSLVTRDWSADYSLTIDRGEMVFTPIGAEVNVVTSRTNTPLSAYLSAHGLMIIMEKEAVIAPGGILIKPNRDLSPFDKEQLKDLDWSGIDLGKESQGPTKDADSIQARMIQEVKSLAAWDIVMDDDDAGEIADIVALRVEGKALVVMLVHCKFCSKDQSGARVPGARVQDLYEVCGQAQKSAEWRTKPELLIRNLARRERNRRSRGISGFEIGTPAKLIELAEKASFLIPEFQIAIAQPGVSRAKVSRPQLNLLASTEVYVRERADSGFTAFISK